MNEDSFGNDIELLLERDQKYTFFTSLGWIMSLGPCVYKIVWSSRENQPASYIFKKNSPLVPFFNNVFAKLQASGTLNGIYQRRYIHYKQAKCSKELLVPFPMKNIPLLLVILGFAIMMSLIILFFEKNMAYTIINAETRKAHLYKNQHNYQ